MSKENEDINEALEQLRRLSSNKQLREIIEREERIERDRIAELQYAKEEGIELGKETGIKQGIERGIEQGIERGEKKKQIEIAKRMLEKGKDIEEIIEMTELTKEEIQKI